MADKNRLVTKHSVCLKGHKTSLSLEREFFEELKRMAAERGLPATELILSIDAARDRRRGGLSGACRLAVLADLRETIARQGLKSVIANQGSEVDGQEVAQPN